MGYKIFLNGELCDQDKARVSVLDHGMLYGYGVFETMRAYDGVVFQIEKHLRRFVQSADAIYLKIPYDADYMRDAVNTTLRANDLRNAYVRMTLTRGAGQPGIWTDSEYVPTFFIYARHFTPYPEDFYHNGVELVISRTRRNISDALDPKVKSCNFLNSIMAKHEAVKRGAHEAVLLSHDGHVAEGSTSNVFIVKDGAIMTPSADTGLLIGVTRNTVIMLAAQNGVPISEKKFHDDSLFSADECFLTSTTMEIMPVARIDGREIGKATPGGITSTLMEIFRENVSKYVKQQKNSDLRP